jgi:hypothetical protein
VSTALENVDGILNINTTWENIREGIKTTIKGSRGCYKIKQHKIQEWSNLIDERMWANL